MTNDNEWEKLVRDVSRAQIEHDKKTAPPGRRAPAEKSHEARISPLKKFFIIASVFFVVVGGGYSLNQHYSVSTPLALESAPSSVTVARPELAPGAANWGTGGSSTYRVSIQAALENRLRPANFLDRFGGSSKLDWKKISTLVMPKDGKPLIVYAVMCARLDEATELRWGNAGFLVNDRAMESPFVRRITISKKEDLDLLLDWHVEGILTSAPKVAGL